VKYIRALRSLLEEIIPGQQSALHFQNHQHIFALLFNSNPTHSSITMRFFATILPLALIAGANAFKRKFHAISNNVAANTTKGNKIRAGLATNHSRVRY
jgi:hypothetical protein